MKNQRWALPWLILIASLILTFFTYSYSNSGANSRIRLNYISCGGTQEVIEFKQGFNSGGPCVRNIISSTPIYPRHNLKWTFYVSLTVLVVTAVYLLPRVLKQRKKALRQAKKTAKQVRKNSKKLVR